MKHYVLGCLVALEIILIDCTATRVDFVEHDGITHFDIHV